MLKLRSQSNKHNAVWLVEPGVSIGRLASNDLIVDDPQVADKQLEIKVSGESLTLVNLAPEKPILVNGAPVTDSIALNLDDRIQLGDQELVVVDPKADFQASTGSQAPASTGWALKANHTALANRIYPLRETMVVGRSSDCEISLAASHLSRRHAQLQVVEGLLYVKDLGSANGTFLNGTQVTEARVKRGDELRFDTLRFGVIGPADDSDKTSVRTPPVAAARTPVKSVPPKPKPTVVASRSTVAPKPAARASSASSVPETSSQGSSFAKVAVVILVGIVVAGAAAYTLLKLI